MTELLINEKNEIDLGNYILQSKTKFSEVNAHDMVEDDACLALAVRLVNKTTRNVEWGKVFYKPMIKNSRANTQEASAKLNAMMQQLMGSSNEEKMAFISKSEGRFFRKPYLNSSFIDPTIASFFENLNHLQEDYPAISLGGRVPKDVIPRLELTYNELSESMSVTPKEKIK